MVQSRYNIKSKGKVRPIAVASAGDFALSDGTEFDPNLLAQSSCWSLYAIDTKRNQAVFVELPETTNLSDAPFAYAAQFEMAKSVAIISLETFIGLSRQIRTDAKLTMLYSTGRCGSTLASRILANLPDVWSISEPDCLTNLTLARAQVPEARMAELLTASRRFICHAAADAPNVVIKPRSEQVFQIAAFSKANPDASNIFMYRDALGYVRSMFRLVQRATGNAQFLSDPHAPQLGWAFASAGTPAPEASPYLSEGQMTFDNLEAIVLGWVLRMRSAADARTSGVPVAFLHYRDLNDNRRDTTARLLEFCGIDTAHLEAGLRGFEHDAHKGSGTDNTVPTVDLNEMQAARVGTLLDHWQQDAFLNGRL